MDFDRRVSKLSAKEARFAIQRIFLLELAETKTGFSKFHDLAMYERSYASAAAIRPHYRLGSGAFLCMETTFKLTTCGLSLSLAFSGASP